ncbi:MAG: AbrB/MazE/SpoVT family DNA-binding domain-containing protein [Clostridia bacterium]|nr:AbrB/MazE/SpoVT family DNA-binding domain-containing protein [Clostridia bacterium]
MMIVNKVRQERTPMEKRRIHISSKRQITIPSKYYEALGLSNEIDCIYANDMLILTPVKNEDTAFAEEILSDLIEQGYSGQKLLNEFKRIRRQIRPAVEKLITEADALAKEASENYIDPTDEIFGIDNKTEA